MQGNLSSTQNGVHGHLAIDLKEKGETTTILEQMWEADTDPLVQ